MGNKKLRGKVIATSNLKATKSIVRRLVRKIIKILEQEKFKYIIIPEYITKDKNLTDKEKNIYSMILTLSKKQECIMSNEYISSMLNISKVHSSRLISSLKNKGYIKVEIIYKKNSKEIAKRILTPINMYANIYKQIGTRPINTYVKDIIKNNNINYNNWRYKSDRDYSNFDWNSLYANNFLKKTWKEIKTELTSHTKGGGEYGNTGNF